MYVISNLSLIRDTWESDYIQMSLYLSPLLLCYDAYWISWIGCIENATEEEMVLLAYVETVKKLLNK